MAATAGSDEAAKKSEEYKMKKLCALMSAFASVAAVLATPAGAADIGVGITETSVGGGPETLSVSGVAGATIAGTTDNWTITLPGVALSSEDLPQVWVEKAGDPGFNVLSIAGSDVLHLLSETANTGTNDDFCGTGSPLGLGVSCFIGTDALENAYFASINEVTQAVPAPAIGAGIPGLLGAVGAFLFWRGRSLWWRQRSGLQLAA
jgi:hypothetical protein